MLNRILITYFSLISQTSDFAPIGAKWWYEVLYDVQYLDSAYAYHTFCLIESVGDSMIDSKNCRELKVFVYNEAGAIYSENSEFVYQDSIIVYRYTAGVFTPLYDFSTNNWFIHNPSDVLDSTEILVESNSVIEVGGIELIQLIVESKDDASWSFGGMIIEKIGDSGYLFPNQWGIVDFYPRIIKLRCYWDDDIYYKIEEDIACDSIFILSFPLAIQVDTESMAISIIIKNDKLLVYSDVINPGKISIYNVNSQLLTSRDFYKFIEIDLKNIPRSLLIVKVSYDNIYYNYNVLCY